MDVPPYGIVVGLAVKVSVGAGVVAEVTVCVKVSEAEPLGPVQLIRHTCVPTTVGAIVHGPPLTVVW